MSRSVAWRRTCSDAVSWHQDEVSNITIYIIRNLGPTSFLLKEEGEDKKIKVYLGDPHRCSCSVFMREKDLCKHICWVLLKKFRVPRQSEISWQLGLVEREINQVLQGISAHKPSLNAQQLAKKTSSENQEGGEEEADGLKQRPIADEDVCPICQEEFLSKRLPVTFCKYGCGNNVHIKCMLVWAEHNKKTTGDNITCPLCREDFGPFNRLQQENRNSKLQEPLRDRSNQHLETTCQQCRVTPIVGKCYKCTVCAEYYFCQACFQNSTHQQHSFQYRERSTQRWRPAPKVSSSILPDAVVNNLQTRDISEQDYDTLLQLDSEASTQPSDLTEALISLFKKYRLGHHSPLLAPGQQCRICLRPYQERQIIRRLTCKHAFHQECIDNWLLHQHPTCPIDGILYTAEGVRRAGRHAHEAARLKSGQNGHISNKYPFREEERKNKMMTGVVTDTRLGFELAGIGLTSLTQQNHQPHGSNNNPSVQATSLQQRINEREDRNQNPDEHTTNDRDNEFIQSVLEENLSRYSPSIHSQQNGSICTSRGENRVSHRRHRPAVHVPYDPYLLIDNQLDRNETPTTSQYPSHSDVNNRSPDHSFMQLTRDDTEHSTNPTLGSLPSVTDAISFEPPPPIGADRKPPPGKPRLGRLRSKPVYKVNPNRSRSTSNLRQRSTSSRDRSQLFIGNDPSSSSGFISEFVTNMVTNSAPAASRRSRRDQDTNHGSPSLTKYQWGSTWKYQGENNDIVLSGNRLHNLTFNDR